MRRSTLSSTLRFRMKAAGLALALLLSSQTVAADQTSTAAQSSSPSQQVPPGSSNAETTTFVVNNVNSPVRNHRRPSSPTATACKPPDSCPGSQPSPLALTINVDQPKAVPPDQGCDGKKPCPSQRSWLQKFNDLFLQLLKTLGYLLLLLLLGWSLSKLLQWFWSEQPKNNVWIVWSIKDDAGTGAAGAVLEALDTNANPLVAPFIQENPKKRKEASGRRQLLLIPPFLDHPVFADHPLFAQGNDPKTFPPFVFYGSSILSNGVLKDYLDWGPNQTFVETISFSERIDLRPVFRLDEAYDDINVKVGNFEVRGVMGIVRLLRRLKYRSVRNVLGFVSHDEKDISGWVVRLNAQDPRKMQEEPGLVASVWADGSERDAGDRLALVAQRAAFKLILRIADHTRYQVEFDARKELDAATKKKTSEPDPRYNTSSIHAIANFRQGIDQLMQLL